MRYSEIVGHGFYNIRISPQIAMMVDIYFSGASHHLWRSREESKHREYHFKLHLAHLRHLMLLVYKFGDFKNAEDRSLRDMDHPESWNPDVEAIPDPDMFNTMLPDIRYEAGQPHPYDESLTNRLAPVSEQTSQGYLKLVANC